MVQTASCMTPLGTSAPDFALPDVVSGKTVRRGDFDGRPLLVMFICNHCPYVKHVRAGLAKLTAEYVAKGVGVVAISSNDATAYPADGPDAMKVEAKEAGYVFPYLFDETQEVAKAYSAACTPDFFLFDRGHKLAYRGQMDASRPKQDVIPVTGKDLRAALDAVIGGKDPAAEQTPSIGCNIKWKPGNEPPYFG
ncbi:MAG TPA: thioredoxin family protein [Planctomycetia bacterium]|nr:thioredoxin family protein [Planctomycetia bacterium]